MSKPKPLERGQFYHVFNRGNNREDIFKEERNYEYFTELLRRHVIPIADVYAYCFLINHFHLLVRIRSESELGLAAPAKFKKSSPSQQFGNCFNAYTKSMNIAYGRTGALFQHPFGRRPVRSREYFITLVTYIHLNPQSHGLTTHFQDWPHSSFATYAENDAQVVERAVERATVVQLFGGLAAFHAAHQEVSTTILRPGAEPRGAFPPPRRGEDGHFYAYQDADPRSDEDVAPEQNEVAG